MIKKIFEELFKPIDAEELEQRGIEKLTYNGMRADKIKLEMTVTIPVSGLISVAEYKNRYTGKMSEARQYEIRYNEKDMEKAIAEQIRAVVTKLLPDELEAEERIHGTQSIGFLNVVYNAAYQRSSSW